MKASEKCLDLIRKYESCKLEAYKCPSGILTIGWGHTKGVKKGQKITQDIADKYLKEDIAYFEKLVNKYDKIYKFKQYEFDSLVSFCFNVGNVDTLTRKGTRSRQEIADSMLLYNKGGGVILEGLQKRRKEEREMFLGTSKVKLYKVTAINGLNCRQKANADSIVLGAFKHGAVLTYISKSKEWLKVKGKASNGKIIQGYVCAKYTTCIVDVKLKSNDS